jgi:hypothetical protein
LPVLTKYLSKIRLNKQFIKYSGSQTFTEGFLNNVGIEKIPVIIPDRFTHIHFLLTFLDAHIALFHAEKYVVLWEKDEWHETRTETG